MNARQRRKLRRNPSDPRIALARSERGIELQVANGHRYNRRRRSKARDLPKRPMRHRFAYKIVGNQLTLGCTRCNRGHGRLSTARDCSAKAIVIRTPKGKA